MDEILFGKHIGGGTQWYYLWEKGKIIGSAHEDDKTAMKKLQEQYDKLKEKYNG